MSASARQRTVLATVALLVVASVAGVGLGATADSPSATDGDVSNGEELKSAEDDDDQLLDTNYTFVPANHQPGAEGSARHFAVGLTENITLHRIKLYSEAIGYSNCEPDNTNAFGIDRGNDDPGTGTDVSLLTSFKKYTSEEDFIDIKYYREDKLAGGPIKFYTVDQVVAGQSGCYDNPSEPGWYRINGTITGSSNGDTTTDYKVRDLSGYFYVCDCSSRAEAEQTLGPPPGQGGDGGDGDSGGSGTPTATATATATPGSEGGSDGTATATSTGTATVTRSATPTADPTATATVTPTATATTERSASGSGDGNGGASPTATATAGGAGGSGDTTTATRSGQARQDGSADGAPRTPTVGAGPGFGVGAALVGALVAGLLALRRD
ncbi:PGF-CTERM sorting domain-containing protein [Haloglomus litoreum]|uniref:PGF-CTERM sorting domain-containing protein n=1 Tax=Haloglomus litoreum TaxID=3034026 RepID=UPI0023E89579|nr:PGF-CTERM sorting domain-containing protein [Haloglomus sp. DT116]